MATWEPQEGDEYLWSGHLVNGKRWRAVFVDPRAALRVNAYRARLYLVRGGKRFLIRRVTN